MNEEKFLKKIVDYPSKSIVQFLVNIIKLRKALDLTSWAFHIFPEDFLQNFPDQLAYAPIYLEDWDDATFKFYEVLDIMYNQFFIAHFGYVETFIDDLTKELYDIFYNDIDGTKISSTGDIVLKVLRQDRYEDISSNMFSRLLLLKNFAGWSRSIFDDIKIQINKYGTIRNTIAHSVGKIKSMKKVEHILSPEIIQKDHIQLDSKTYQNYSDGMIEICIRINNDIVSKNPKLTDFMNRK